MRKPQEQLKNCILYRELEGIYKPQENKNTLEEQPIKINYFIGYNQFKTKEPKNKFIIVYKLNEVLFNHLQINIKLEPQSSVRFSGLSKEEEAQAVKAFVLDILDKHKFKELEGYKYFYGYMLER